MLLPFLVYFPVPLLPFGASRQPKCVSFYLPSCDSFTLCLAVCKIAVDIFGRYENSCYRLSLVVQVSIVTSVTRYGLVSLLSVLFC